MAKLLQFPDARLRVGRAARLLFCPAKPVFERNSCRLVLEDKWRGGCLDLGFVLRKTETSFPQGQTENRCGELIIQLSRDPFAFGKTKYKPDEIERLDELLRHVESQPCSIWAEATYDIPLGDLPSRGVVRSLLSLNLVATQRNCR